MNQYLCLIIISMFFHFSAFACSEMGLYHLMTRLSLVGRIHNCNFEVVFRNDELGNRKYMLWVQDRRLSPDIQKRTVTFEFDLPNECLLLQANPQNYSPIMSSFGYEVAGIRYRTALKIELSNLGNPKSILLQEVNLSTGEISKRVNCTADGGWKW